MEGRMGILKRAVAIVLVAGAVLATWFALRPARQAHAPGPRDARAAADSIPARSPEYPDTVLEARLRSIMSRAPARFGIVAKHLGNGAIARVNPAERIPLMSVVKLPVAIVVLDGVDHGQWSLSTPITLLPGDVHPRGRLGDRFPRGGGPVSIYELLSDMLRLSDNTSADALMRFVGGPLAVTSWLERHGIRDLRVDRSERGLGNDWYGLAPGADTMGSAEEIRKIRAEVPEAIHDSAARAMLLDPRDTGTARACVDLLERLWDGDLLSASMTDTLQSILARCKTAPHRLPALLPKGTHVARKTGTGGTSEGITVAVNDVGVIRLPNGDEVAIAVLVGEPRGSVRRTEKLIAQVARSVYDAWSTERSPAAVGVSRAPSPPASAPDRVASARPGASGARSAR
jgi:beta-lactamase class A